MIDWLISPAYAAEAAGPGPGFDILILVGFALIFYVMLWRPQSKRAKEHKQLVESLAKGDEIVTSGGILGKISEVEEQFILVEVGDGMELRFQKASVAAALPKGTLKNS